MAARRLLAAMLVFLAISTVLAALAPRPTEPGDEPRTRTTTTSPVPEPVRGHLVRRRLRLEPRSGELRAQRDLLRVRAGDQLMLIVSAPRVVTLELPGLGVTETAGPDDPGRIDVFLSGAGRHVMRDASSGRRLLRIEVQNQTRKPTPKGPTGGSTP